MLRATEKKDHRKECISYKCWKVLLHDLTVQAIRQIKRLYCPR